MSYNPNEEDDDNDWMSESIKYTKKKVIQMFIKEENIVAVPHKVIHLLVSRITLQADSWYYH